MKKFLLSASAIVAVAAATSSAFAADLPARTYTKAPAYTAPAVVYNWTGFYIGGHVGGAFGGDNSLLGSNSGQFMGGVQGGFDYQFATNWVLGIEANYSWMGTNNTGFAYTNGTTVFGNNNELGSVTGRLGYTWGPTLLYAKGGYAWRGNNDLTVTSLAPATPVIVDGNAKSGYTVGAGLEYMFTPNWSGKIEYQYYNFGNTTLTSTAFPAGVTSFNNDEHTIKAGLNYRFGWGGPEIARY